MNKEEAKKEIDCLVKLAYDYIKKAENLADEYNLGFDFSLAYGMGGYYNPIRPKLMTKAEAIELIRSDKPISEDQKNQIVKVLENNSSDNDWSESSYDSEGWVSSSQSC